MMRSSGVRVTVCIASSTLETSSGRWPILVRVCSMITPTEGSSSTQRIVAIGSGLWEAWEYGPRGRLKIDPGGSILKILLIRPGCQYGSLTCASPTLCDQARGLRGRRFTVGDTLKSEELHVR